MKQHNHIGRNEEGGVLIEAGLLLPIMLMVFLAMMEIAQYIDAKDRLNKITNQAAAALSSITRFGQNGDPLNPPESIALVRYSNLSASLAMRPYGLKLDYQACNWPSDVAFLTNSGAPGGSPQYTARGGTCGLGKGPAWTAAPPRAGCPTFTTLPGNTVPYGYPTVSVTASCTFYPILSFNLFTRGIVITSNNQAPMQFF